MHLSVLMIDFQRKKASYCSCAFFEDVENIVCLVIERRPFSWLEEEEQEENMLFIIGFRVLTKKEMIRGERRSIWVS